MHLASSRALPGVWHHRAKALLLLAFCLVSASLIIPRAGAAVVSLERNGVQLGFFTEMSGAGSRNDVLEQIVIEPGGEVTTKLPSVLRWQEISLRRAMATGASALVLSDWRKQVEMSDINGARSTAAIVLYDDSGEALTEIIRWNLRSAWPRAINTEPDSKAGALMEELVLVHEGPDIESPPSAMAVLADPPDRRPLLNPQGVNLSVTAYDPLQRNGFAEFYIDGEFAGFGTNEENRYSLFWEDPPAGEHEINVFIVLEGDVVVPTPPVLLNIMSDAIVLSNNEVLENQLPGTLAGTFSAPALLSPFFYLVDGPGDEDNPRFNVASDSLLTSEPFDFEVQNTRSIRIGVSDIADFNGEQEFTIRIIDGPDPVSPKLENVDRQIHEIAPGEFVTEVSVLFQDAPLRIFRIDASDNLLFWETIGHAPSDDSGFFLTNEVLPGIATRRFWRVFMEPAEPMEEAP